MHTHQHRNEPPQPRPAPDPGTLPRPLTIFLTADEHAAAVRALRRLHTDRAKALMKALRVGGRP